MFCDYENEGRLISAITLYVSRPPSFCRAFSFFSFVIIFSFAAYLSILTVLFQSNVSDSTAVKTLIL